MKNKKYLKIIIVLLAVVLLPTLGFCSVESTLSAIQGKLTTTILPLVAILGLVFAAFSFISGNAVSYTHLTLPTILLV